jgi:antiphage defense system Thoeris ThsB-like protein
VNTAFSPFGATEATTIEKPGVFISYHHDGDQAYYDYFARVFADFYRIIRDNSLRQEIWSDDPDYVMRRIREDYITGTSCTVVLCGKQTPWRKFVDWEIKASLDKEHALVGISLPTAPINNGKVFVPNRFFDNYQTGYGRWLSWDQLFPNEQPNVAVLRAIIASANAMPTTLIANMRSLRSRNGVPPY